MHDGTSEKFIINQRMFNYNIGQGIEKTMYSYEMQCSGIYYISARQRNL